MSGYLKSKPGNKRRTGSYFKCETCGCEFYLCPSYIRTHEKNGTKIRFCSMKCYDKTGGNNPFHGKKHSIESKKKMTDNPNRPRFKRGEGNPNFVRFGSESDFEGITKSWWKDKLIKDIGHCEVCGFSDKRILTVHHKDSNKGNNTKGNLSLLCWNCHMLIHYEAGSGPYHMWNEK